LHRCSPTTVLAIAVHKLLLKQYEQEGIVALKISAKSSSMRMASMSVTVNLGYLGLT